MRRQVALLLLVVVGFAATGCRSRKQVTPATVPPAPVEPRGEPATPVAPTTTDFETSRGEDDEVLPRDLGELNDMARERGWIRDALFAYDEFTLDDDARRALDTSAQWLRSNPAYAIRIEGHCDERGTEQYNLALGDRRASTAADYLAALGIDRTRIRTVSYGESRPFDEGSDEAAWAQNRRAHLVIIEER
ncbi:MAG TPA: peptidoglycan-associated lipoprotein Pal [Thermoanaerobaculia bacterium]|nr:peptidoglycan-associated lipoprotein Pal [Thermoanaerobaculia bacterium]